MRNLRTAGWMSRSRIVVALAAALALAGCGGGGGGSSSTNNCLPFQTSTECATSGGGTTTTTQTATQLSLSVDTPTIQTNGSSTVTLSATLKDSKNAVVPGATVTFTADSGTISASTATTNASGVASITFNSNDNKTNRTVNFTATSGSLSQATSVVVQGTRIGFGGDTSSVAGKVVSMSVVLLDGAGKAIANQSVGIRSKLGNRVPGSVTTDVNGQATVTFTPDVAGTDTITASALGAQLSQDLVVSAVNYAFVSPAVDSTINVNVCSPVTVRLAGAVATHAKFTVSRGQVYSDSGCTSSATPQLIPFVGATATAYVMSPGAGAATVYAELYGSSSAAQANLPIKFIATVANSIIVQGDPTVVIVNGSSSVTAIVKDSSGNPVSGQTVVFSVPNGGGVPEPTTAVTNDSGAASTTFKADASISGKDSVQVKASVAGVAPAVATLTVAGQAVNIAIGTDNQVVIVDSTPTFRKVWAVLVSDPASGPIKNQVVTVSLRGVAFHRGYYSIATGETKWSQQITTETLYPGICLAEDANNNGTVETGELGDRNGNGVLEPNGAAIVRAPTSSGGLSATVTTDETGTATFYVEYLRAYASWVMVELKATASVAGKNSSASRTFFLPIPASEVLDKDVEPSFRWSPFGQNPSCLSY